MKITFSGSGEQVLPSDVSCHTLSKGWTDHKQDFAGSGWHIHGQEINSVLDTRDKIFSPQQWVLRTSPEVYYLEYRLG